MTATVRFDPAGPLRGDYTPPADKSISHRAALFGAMCDEPVTVDNYLDSEDTRSTLNALRALGAGVESARAGRVLIRGVGLHAPLEATGGLLDVGNAGTLMRLLPGWLAGQPGGVWTLDGDESIRRRPGRPVAEPLRLMGATVEARDGRFPPLHGRRRAADRHRLRAARRERAGQVVRADRGDAGRGLHHGARGRAEPRPHRAPPAPARACRSSATACGSTVAQVDELELDEVVGAGRPVVGGVLRGRRDPGRAARAWW